MQVRTFTVGNFQVNTYLLTDEATGVSAILDTGETDELVRRLQSLQPAPDIQMILLTHTHLDHAGALSMLQEVWNSSWPTSRTSQILLTRFPTKTWWVSGVIAIGEL